MANQGTQNDAAGSRYKIGMLRERESPYRKEEEVSAGEGDLSSGDLGQIGVIQPSQSGVILLAEEVLQVKPLPARLRPSVQEGRGDPGRGLQSEDVPHVIFPAWNHKLHLYNHIGQGLAPVGGVCYRDHNCVITELGTTSDAGKPYPSAGWTSAYVAAHEIGHNGRCVAGPQNVLKPVPGGWGHWFEDSCHSGCILNAKGFRRDQRRCDSPKPRNTVHTCEGSPFRVRLCDDSNVTRQWQACAVYCKITNGPWYTPRTELNDAGGAFFPDGTWCHNDGRRDYYCQNHVCQRQVSKGRSLSLTDTVLDDPVLRTQPPLGPSRLYPLRPSAPRATSQRLSSLLLPSTPPDPSSFIFEGEQQDTPVAVGILQQPGDVDDQGYTDRDYVTVPGIVR
ncbi:hypothetical protein IscW_ISCW021701 [Ixodes scapularis]|uniref:Uncharacterized protein n=1 Tax=Ixodes scapularis TaxID=6945 RepID=B7Q401_IXOSC|nr:hypothetical protein IscW_ISCW021701 [Ixodes scapularis]|eukprot:XP_002411430.1 hypothetical protein IscW_ISCW021701 [Ixodes scapularis]